MKKFMLLAVSLLVVMVGSLATLAQNSAQAKPLLTPTPSPIPGPCVTPPPFPTATPWMTITPTPVFTPTPTPSTTGSPTPTPCFIPPTITPYATITPFPCPTRTPLPPQSGMVIPDPCSSTPAVTPTTTPIFSATVHVTPSHTQVAVGETVTVTVDLTVSEGCQLPVYMLTLDQTGPDGALFTPAEVMVGPGVPMPTTITVTAVTTGTTTFHAEVDGERNCGDGWLWVYLHGYSEAITVAPETPPGGLELFQFLPLIIRSIPIYGSVLIENGVCCLGAIAGETIPLDTAFFAVSSMGTVDKMRTNLAAACLDETMIMTRPWEPFVPTKTFTLTVPLNFVGFNVSVQYGDDAGNLSPVYCDDIVIEGFPPSPTPSP